MNEFVGIKLQDYRKFTNKLTNAYLFFEPLCAIPTPFKTKSQGQQGKESCLRKGFHPLPA